MKKFLLIFIALWCAVGYAGAQERKISPVDKDEQKPEQPILHYYDKHGNQLNEPVLFLATLDTVQAPKAGPKYPGIRGVDIGVNFFDAIMRIARQKYSSFDVWADLNISNWFFPVLEAGIGFANDHPDDGNYRYKAKPTPYVKAGINYNFFYKSNPAYRAYFGVRLGFTHTSYEITDIQINNGYWQQDNVTTIKNQKASCFFGEIVAGINVKLWRNISMGWSGRYRLKIHRTQPDQSKPWFFPGYGTKSPLSATLSIIYTIPFRDDERVTAPEP